MTDLQERYDGVENALADVTAAVEVCGVLHRVDADGGAWCGTNGDFELFETADALALGGRPCGACFGAVAEHMARTDGTGVTHTGETPDVPADSAVETVKCPDGRPRLDALTADVLVASTRASAFHAPAADTVAVCGEQVEGTRRPVEQAPPSTRPCRDCFTESVVVEHAPRRATAPTIDAATDGGRFGEK